MKQQLEEKIKRIVTEKVNPGYHSGGSGHLGCKGMKILSMDMKEKDKRWEITCVYETWTDSEFDTDIPNSRYTVFFEVDPQGVITETNG